MSSATLAEEKLACRPEVCSLVRGIKRVGSSWNLIVAAYLLDGPRRFNQILQMGRSDSLSARTLSRVLKSLVEGGFVKRSVIGTQPFAVEYSLTAQGQKLGTLLEAYRDLDPRRRR